MSSQAGTDDPRRPLQPSLSNAQRRRAALFFVAPTAVVAVVLAPFVVIGAATFGDLVAAAIVYGALLGLAAGFVAIDRMHARQCLRCGTAAGRGTEFCPACGYDLIERPRYACDQRHAVYVDEGLCDCGRRLQPLPTARGVGHEVKAVLKFGAWLLAFFIGMGILLNFVS